MSSNQTAREMLKVKVIPKGLPPWHKMKIGDNCFVEGGNFKTLYEAAVRWVARNQPTWRFSVKKKPTGCNVLRVN